MKVLHDARVKRECSAASIFSLTSHESVSYLKELGAKGL